MKYSALILDMDGTIIDSLGPITDSLKETADMFGFRLTGSLISQAKYSTTRALKELLPFGADNARFLDAWIKSYGRHAQKIRLFPGMEKVASAGIKRGIVTSESRRELLLNLERLGLSAARFDALVAADDTPYEKPHPYPLLHCLERMDTEAGHALFVGDGISDMHCATAAGVDFGLALWGADSDAGFHKAKYILRRPEDILKLMR